MRTTSARPDVTHETTSNDVGSREQSLGFGDGWAGAGR